MTEAEAGVIRAVIQHLQDERDILSDEKQIAENDVQQFPFAYPLYGPVPESGAWLDHLRTPVNEATAGKYDAAVARARSLNDRYEANVTTSRALEALLS